MGEASKAATSVGNASMAQAGKLLCVSENIYPHGLRHGINLAYGGMRKVGGFRPPVHVRMAGEEFVDLRELARRASSQAYGGVAAPHVERDGRR